jgi:hypothetical protein
MVHRPQSHDKSKGKTK